MRIDLNIDDDNIDKIIAEVMKDLYKRTKDSYSLMKKDRAPWEQEDYLYYKKLKKAAKFIHNYYTITDNHI